MPPPRRSHGPRRARQDVADISMQLAALRKLTVGQLRERYREVFGEPTRSRNKDYLRKKVAWQIQAQAEGGLSDRVRGRFAELSGDVPARRRSSGNGPASAPTTDEPADAQASRDPRLPEPGIVLTRVHGGIEHKVTVLDDGFEYGGERFASLSKVARQIAGTNWNGFLFFGLQRRMRKQNGESR